jgi:hypothetical protein
MHENAQGAVVLVPRKTHTSASNVMPTIAIAMSHSFRTMGGLSSIPASWQALAGTSCRTCGVPCVRTTGTRRNHRITRNPATDNEHMAESTIFRALDRRAAAGRVDALVMQLPGPIP